MRVENIFTLKNIRRIELIENFKHSDKTYAVL